MCKEIEYKLISKQELMLNGIPKGVGSIKECIELIKR